MSAEQGCQLGIHWMGVFYNLGWGVSKNIDKAIEYLTKSSKEGNGQSSFQLYVIFTSEEGYKDAKKAYHYLEKACLVGVTMFDSLHQLFQDNYDELLPVFLENKKPSTMVDKDNKTDIINMHGAYVNELKNSFS